MAFDISKFVKLPAFLQFVGLALAAVMMYLVPTSGFGHVAKAVAVIAIFVSFAGFIYDKLYP